MYFTQTGRPHFTYNINLYTSEEERTSHLNTNSILLHRVLKNDLVLIRISTRAERTGESASATSKHTGWRENKAKNQRTSEGQNQTEPANELEGLKKQKPELETRETRKSTNQQCLAKESPKGAVYIQGR